MVSLFHRATINQCTIASSCQNFTKIYPQYFMDREKIKQVEKDAGENRILMLQTEQCNESIYAQTALTKLVVIWLMDAGRF